MQENSLMRNLASLGLTLPGSYLTDAYNGDICSYAGLLCDDPWILEATEFNPGQCCLSERSDKSRHEAGNDQRDSPG